MQPRTLLWNGPEFQEAALAMIKAQGGIFGWVSDSKRAIAALSA